MGPGSNPDHDDYGLPHVDVIIPDDARELDRDVQAYHRELRQRRRRERMRRLLRPFTNYGVLIPIVAALLLVVSLAGLALTYLGPQTPRATPRRLASPSTVPVGEVGGLLPDTTLRVGSGDSSLRDLRPALIALVPPGCRCDTAVEQLTRQALALPIGMYLVASGRPGSELTKLANTAGHGAAVVIEDSGRTLETTYHPSGLTVLLVHTDGIVGGVLRDVQPGQGPWLEHDLVKLQQPGQGHPAMVTG